MGKAVHITLEQGTLHGRREHYIGHITLYKGTVQYQFSSYAEHCKEAAAMSPLLACYYLLTPPVYLR